MAITQLYFVMVKLDLVKLIQSMEEMIGIQEESFQELFRQYSNMYVRAVKKNK